MVTKPDLTRRERFCRLYDFERADRPPRWEAIAFWGETIEQWKAQGGLPGDADPMAHYGFEPRYEISANLGFTGMTLSGPPVQTRIIEDDGHTRVCENDLGSVWRERLDGTSMPQFIRFPVESHRDWLQKIKPRLDPQAHDFGTIEPAAGRSRTSDDPWGFMLVGLYAFWRNLWGGQNLAYAFYDQPETLHDMADTWLKMHCECTPRVLEAARLDYTFFHEDMAFKTAPLIGPNLFRQFMAPHYRPLIEHLRHHGQRRFLLDSDGQNGQVLDEFIELGIGGMFPFEVAAGYNIAAFRTTHPRFMVWGGIDKRVLLRTKADIRRVVLENVPAVWETGGFIPAIDHAVPPCPRENFEYYLELIRGMFP